MAVEGYDLVMLGILAVAALLGYFKGIVWQIAWIAGIVVSGWVALRFATPVAPYFGQQAPWNRFLAMLALYAGTSLAVWLVFRMVSGFISAIHLSAFDHQLGLLLGIAKGALLCVVVTFFAVTLAPAYRHQIVASRSGRFVAEIIVRADRYLPKEIHDTVEPFVDQFERQFAQPGMGGASLPEAGASFAGTAPQGAAPALSLESIFAGMGSVAAWAGGGTGAGGGAVQQAGGALPEGSAWFAAPAAQTSAARPVAFQTPAAAPAPRPASSRYATPVASPFEAPSAPPATFNEPPAAYPLGTQSPLPRR